MGLGQTFLMVLLFLTAIFLIVLVLIQRGKGGGLAGALGGMGGQSAFGTKAGDLFTKITIGVAAFWIILCLVAGKSLAPRASKLEEAAASQAVEQKDQPGPTSEKASGKAPAKASEKAPEKTPAPAEKK
jgi:preprotein translocase subunit SecG